MGVRGTDSHAVENPCVTFDSVSVGDWFQDPLGRNQNLRTLRFLIYTGVEQCIDSALCTPGICGWKPEDAEVRLCVF